MKLFSVFSSTVGAPVRRLARMVFRRDGYRFMWQPRSSFNFAREVGDGTASSTVMAPVLWMARTFPEAPPALWKPDADGNEEQIRDHLLLRLLARPNAYYTSIELAMATVIDFLIDGNAYWLKIRSEGGYPVELWWTPHWMIKPRGTEDEFITHYDYWSGVGETVPIDPSDVVHFRYGLDSGDPRRGYSPLKSVLREVFTDDEAANFTATLLRNAGVPGLVFSPDGGSATEEQAEEAKARAMEMFTGDRRGEPLVMRGPTKVEQFGFSPQELVLRDLRQIPEERVSGVVGVPAIVAGLGAGLARSTFTNFVEARSAAYDSALIPTQRQFAETVRFQLLTDFEPDPFIWRFGYDLSQVKALQEDEYKVWQRLDLGVRGGWIQVAEARRKTGHDVTDADKVYIRPAHTYEVVAGDTRPVPGTQPGRGGPTNGHDSSAQANDIAEQVIRAIERERLRTG